jgi:transglutaminase superfamily protein
MPLEATDAPAVVTPLPTRAKLALAAEILLTYTRARARLARGGFREAVGGLRAVAPAKPAPPHPVPEGRRLGSAVVRTLRLLPTDSRCLMRSLVLTRLLARRGIPATLVIGVRKDDEFAAHAWVEYEGTPLLDPGDPNYARLVEL